MLASCIEDCRIGFELAIRKKATRRNKRKYNMVDPATPPYASLRNPTNEPFEEKVQMCFPERALPTVCTNKKNKDAN